MKATLISPVLSDPQTVMPRSLVWLFAIASGLSVANVYYAQPLLDALARDFAIGDAAIGGVIAATQIGCALALLLLVPLGDRVNRRRLMATQVILLIAGFHRRDAIGLYACRWPAGYRDDPGANRVCRQRRRAP